MRALHIPEVREFMVRLLLRDTFDELLLLSCSLTTNITYTIDGTLHPEFYDSDEAARLRGQGQICVHWRDVRPFCYSLIRGKHTPLRMDIRFQIEPGGLPDEITALPQREDIAGLYLNFRFDGKHLYCVSGISKKSFTFDKTADAVWDDAAYDYLKKLEIAVEET